MKAGAATIAVLDGWAERLSVPPGAWGYVLRIWGATVLALGVAFWLQLESASSAAVCVGILAQPRRGQALSKAFYRFVGTVVGFGVSIVIAGLFGQDRVLTLVSYGAWLGLCVFAAHYLQGTRAYGAMLSGYTVAIITVANIDTPGNVFTSGVSRVAAITIGIVSIALVNDVFGAPNAYPDLRAALGRARHATQAYIRGLLGGPVPTPSQTLDVVRQVGTASTDIASIAGEFGDGPARVAGARSLVASLFAEVSAGRGFADAAARDTAGEAARLAERVGAGLSGDASAGPELDVAAAALVADPSATPDRVLLHRRAADILRQERWADDGERALTGLGPPGRTVALPVHRDFPDALRGAARVVVTYGLCAALFVLSGWTATSTALLQVSSTAAISSITPNPAAFAAGALVAMPIVVVCAGIAKFLVLSGGQGFPLLAITLFPVIAVGCLLSLKPKTFTVGFILIVFFPVVLAPANPQSYDPQTYIETGVLFLLAALLLFLGLRLVLPTSPAQKRLWSMDSARSDIVDALRGTPLRAEHRVALDGDRLAQFAARRRVLPDGRPDPAGSRHALTLARLDTAATELGRSLDGLREWPELRPASEAARAALRRLDAAALEDAATGLLAAAAAGPDEARGLASYAVADLAALGHLVRGEHRVLARFGLAEQTA